MINEALIVNIERYLKNTFINNQERLKHIYNVKKVAVALGEIYNVNISHVIVASYLHDVTKILSDTENIEIAGEEYNESVPKACTHAYAAVKIAISEFGIENEDILNAIKYHCSGRKNMSMLEKVVYVSDFIEEGRDFVTEGLRNIAKQDINKAVLEIMIQTKKYILKQKEEFSSLTEEAIIYYQNELEEFND